MSGSNPTAASGPSPAGPAQLRLPQLRPVVLEHPQQEHGVRLAPQAPEISFSASFVSSLRGCVFSHQAHGLVQPGLLHQLEELARVLRGADALDPERVERVAEHEVVAVLGDLARSDAPDARRSRARSRPSRTCTRRAAPSARAGRSEPRLELLREQLLRPLVLDHQNRHRRGTVNGG